MPPTDVNDLLADFPDAPDLLEDVARAADAGDLDDPGLIPISVVTIVSVIPVRH
jgi:hypothetical protein